MLSAAAAGDLLREKSQVYPARPWRGLLLQFAGYSLPMVCLSLTKRHLYGLEKLQNILVNNRVKLTNIVPSTVPQHVHLGEIRGGIKINKEGILCIRSEQEIFPPQGQ